MRFPSIVFTNGAYICPTSPPNVCHSALTLLVPLLRLFSWPLLAHTPPPMGFPKTYSGDVDKGINVAASPTVGDLDGDGTLEVIVGTVRGGLHVVDASSG